MLQSFFLTAWRNLLKDKFNTVINIAGLTISFTCCVLLFLMVYFEFSYDGFHKNKATLFEVYNLSHTTSGEEESVNMGYPVAPVLKSEVPGVVRASAFMWGGEGISYGDKELDKGITLVDNDFFDMFSFPVLAGNAGAPLGDLGSVVLSKSTADALFGAADPLQKTVKVKVNGKWRSLVVAAIIDDAPQNSSLKCNILARIELADGYAELKNSWNNQDHPVFIQLAPNFTPAAVESSLRSIVRKYHVADSDNKFALKLAPITGLHFDANLGMDRTVSKQYLYSFVLIGLVVLFIACFNFINLNIARNFTRAREVGIRKTLGAGNRVIFFQLWTEGFLFCVVALSLALVSAALLLKPFDYLFGESFKIVVMFRPLVILTILAGLILISFLAGGYPAFVVSHFRPVEVLKGKVSVRSSALLRNGLITFQFVMAGVLVSSTIIIYSQFQYMRNASLGFQQESVISIPVKNGENYSNYIRQLRLKLFNDPQVLSISGSSSNIGVGEDKSESSWSIGFNYKGKAINTDIIVVDYDYLKTLGVKPVAGRDFNRAYASDTAVMGNNIIVTESMARQFGENNPLGLSFYPDSASPKYTIIGIIPDLQMFAMREKRTKLMLQMNKGNSMGYILVKVRSDNMLHAMNTVKSAYHEIDPDNDVMPSFLTENTRRWYEKEQRLSNIFFSASFTAILLSCLGLLGIVSLVMYQRRKEIGVRKVLGASLGSILVLLSKDFLKLVLLACVISTPIALYFLNIWLQGFAYRVTLGWWVFILSGIILLLIALVTISFQTIKSSLIKPATSLRTE